MATNIDLFLDAKGGGLLIGGSAQGGALPDFFRNDVYNFRLRVLEEDQNGQRVDSSLQSPAFKLGMGNLDEGPTVGNFQLTLAGPVTSLQIPYNATTLQVFNAVSGIAGQVSVSTYGLEDQSWLITAAMENTALSFGGDSGTLFPTSSVLVSTRRFPEPNIKAEQVVKIRQSPAIYANNFTASSTVGVISLSKSQDGSVTANEVYNLAIGNDAIGGSYFVRYGNNSSTAIPISFTAVSVQPILTAICGVGTGNISVTDLDGQRGFSIAFTGALAAQNITTALEIDATGAYFAKYYESLVTMGTAELEELFSASENLQINPVIEIEVSESAQAQTLLQSTARIRKDLITSGAAIPATQESYYTKNEADSIFATIATINLNYYTKLQVDDLLDAITGASVTGDYYTKAQSDNRYPTTAAISASYYTKTDSDSRYPTTAAISASYYTKTETGNLFVEDSASNVSASSRQLVNSATQIIIDWQSGAIGYSGVLQVPTATTASGITISSILNITTQTVISGNLTVLGTISGSGVSIGDVYTKTESDNRFVRNSTTGVYATNRSLNDAGGGVDLEWGSSAVRIWENLVVTAGGELVVDGSSALKGYVVMNSGFISEAQGTITGASLQINNGGISIENLSVIPPIELNINAGQINGITTNATLNEINCNYLYVENSAEFLDVSVVGNFTAETFTAVTINATHIDTVSISASTFNLFTTNITAASMTVTTINVTCGFGFGGSAPTARFQSVNAISINTSTSVTWTPLQVCSDGTPTTLWVFAGTATSGAPIFLGHDEEVRRITRQVVHVLSQNYFGFVNATSLTYP